MRDKQEYSLATSINSPGYFNNHNFNASGSKFHHLYSNSTLGTTPHQSKTESQIYSHDLVREVMENSRKRSIYHEINKIDKDTALYSVPLDQNTNQFDFDCIPTKNEIFASMCSATIKNINNGLVNDRNKGQSLIGASIKNRPTSARPKIESYNPKISVSGLVTFDFNSVKAKKSIAFSKATHQQKLEKQIQENEEKVYCASRRNRKILAKSSQRRYERQQRKNKQITKFDSNIDEYLRNIIKKEKDNALIYGQKCKKINYIKEYMQKQKVDYEQSHHAVELIELATKKIKNNPIKPSKGIQPGESQLEGRRQPVKRKSVFLQHFHFIE